MTNRLALIAALALVPLTGCDKNPVDRLTNPLPDGSLSQSSGVYVIYDDEVKTGGGIALIPGAGNQALDFRDTTGSQGRYNIAYSWNGQPILDADTGQYQQLFAGFLFLIKPDFPSNNAAPARDLSAPGYNRLTFQVKGQLAEGVHLEVKGPSNGDGSTTNTLLEIERTSISNTWTEFSLVIPPGDFTAVKTFLSFALVYSQPPRTTNPGQGGTIYIDEVRYEIR